MTGSRPMPKSVEIYLLALQNMLKAIRSACGLSQANIADALGINRATYTNYESGKSYPDLITVIELAKMFQIPPESFLYPEEYSDLDTARQRVKHTPMVNPEKIGDLSKEEKELIASYRLQAGEPTWAYDSLSREVDNALSQFAVKKNYMGYPILVSAICEALSFLPDSLTMTEMCEQVAAKEDTATKAVSRELTRIVNSIWYTSKNPPIYNRIVGFEVAGKPLPLDFIYAMAHYITRQDHKNTA